jgi:predicted Zn finger-like uncharacterized protein
MLIVCPDCASEYVIEPAQIGADGRNVRCASCRSTFFVAGEPEVTEEELAETEEYKVFLESQTWPEAIPSQATAERADERQGRAKAGSRSRLKATLGKLGAIIAGLRAIPAGPAMAMLVIGAGVGLVLGREPIVRAVPRAAPLYAAIRLPVNPTGLELRGVRSELVVNGADRLLVVEGEVLNVAAREVGVPSLELAVRGPAGLALYTWTNEAPRKRLGPAESARFRARLASPPAEGREVLVRFAEVAGGTTVSARAP